MSRRTQIIVLSVLLVVLLVTVYFSTNIFRSDSTVVTPAVVDAAFKPLAVDNPALRLDILKRFLSLEYKGVHRNIFSDSLPPPPAPPISKRAAAAAGPSLSGPPPLSVGAKYFGFVSDREGNHRKAFFITTDDQSVVIAGEGDMLLGRFRVDRITSTSVDVEEVSSGRHATLNLEQPGPNG
ncbi:MAG TPA: hypothetical protein VNI36_01730 [Candidatus Dormibacteraeota bacterium]|nr:hypothetical protein [Candidatus Dormibacteraeota bacterium]